MIYDETSPFIIVITMVAVAIVFGFVISFLAKHASNDDDFDSDVFMD